MNGRSARISPQQVLTRADELQRGLSEQFRDRLVESLYAEAQRIAERVVTENPRTRRTFDARVDRLVTSRVFGPVVMLMMLTVVFWITVTGANLPSAFLAGALMEQGGLDSFLEERLGVSQAPAFLSVSLYELLHRGFSALHAPAWLSGFWVDGVYLALAWVVSVMLPPMAIFFPLWTILEDLGYLPRVAFNLDWLFNKAGAHGKQALTMAMGFGCNAAGVMACRVIDSPRERLIAILTNNFMICNGRFPTQIMLASVFVAASFPPYLVSLVAAGAVVGIVLLGVLFTLLASYGLSHTVLRGEPSVFTLELPPYRRPSILRIMYTSVIDRTLFVLGRAIVVAAPAGGVIWIAANVHVGGASLAQHMSDLLGPLGRLMGLDGIILLSFIVAIPANEIIVPTMLMLYLSQGMMTEEMLDTPNALRSLLVDQHGWTMLTAVNLMLFSLLHNPCGTTILTIWKETRSRKWTLVSVALPVVLGVTVTVLLTTIVRACT